MAHFAKLGVGNIVEQVVVVSNDIAITEQAGIEFLRNLYKDSNAQWVQTSYNRNFRKNFAGVGSLYDMYKDVFINIKPYDSWVLNEDTCQWEAPVAEPNDNLRHFWNEQTKSWDSQ
jgi:hypothetical protein